VIAVDTNILLYAHREEAPWHEAATRCLADVARERWAIPWPCVHEFLAIATHPRIFDPPSRLDDALLALESWRSMPTTTFLSEMEGYPEVLASVLRGARVVGPRIHDARIAALCKQHAVAELWTADRDFSRYGGLVARNPLV
jgi:hypothetical protein